MAALKRKRGDERSDDDLGESDSEDLLGLKPARKTARPDTQEPLPPSQRYSLII